MTRGNQREMDRAKAQKKASSQGKTKKGELPFAKRAENDAEIMRAKQAAKAAAKADGGGTSSA
ncbi:hypothetical protein BGZ65_006360, partial [Modicella reniformis]